MSVNRPLTNVDLSIMISGNFNFKPSKYQSHDWTKQIKKAVG